MESSFLTRDQTLSLWSESTDSKTLHYQRTSPAAAAAKSLQLCLTLCDPIDGSLPVSPVSGILQARTLEWVATSSSNACMWSHFSHVQLCVTPWIAAHQAPLSTGFSGRNTGVGCHALLQGIFLTQGSNPRLLHLWHCTTWEAQQSCELPPNMDRRVEERKSNTTRIIFKPFISEEAVDTTTKAYGRKKH